MAVARCAFLCSKFTKNVCQLDPLTVLARFPSWIVGDREGRGGKGYPPNENPGYGPIAACHSLLELTEISGTDVSQRSTTKWSQCFSKFSQLSAFKLIQLGIQSSSFNLVSPKSWFNLVRLRQPAALVWLSWINLFGFTVRPWSVHRRWWRQGHAPCQPGWSSDDQCACSGVILIIASFWRVPSQMNSVLSAFNLSRFDDIHVHHGSLTSNHTESAVLAVFLVANNTSNTNSR